MSEELLKKQPDVFELTKKQQEILQAAIDGHNVLMTGPGGVGKSCVIERIVDKLKKTKRLEVTAMTGAAAALIGGRTLHSTLGIGLGNADVDTLYRRLNHVRVRGIKTLIIDEVSMLSNVLLDKIDELVRKCKKNDLPFGGIQLILSGDFLQLPTIQDDFCFKAKCWETLDLKVILMNEIKRQEAIEFQNVLNKARFGKITTDDIRYLTSGGSEAYNHGILPTKILCKNIDVDNINQRELEKLNASVVNKYHKEVIIYDSRYESDDVKYICNAPDTLNLAVGAQVMMLTNTYSGIGLINGSRGIVTSFNENDLPIVKFVNSEEELLIDYHRWSIEKNEPYFVDDEVKYRTKIIGRIRAIPLRLAWAITCHKSQGVSIDSAYIDLAGVFTEGQAYVAISRVRSHKALILKNATPKAFKAHRVALEYYNSLTQ